MRKKLIKAFNWWLNIDQEKLDILEEIIETLHNASLIIDDIEDSSDRRRGKPSAHMLFGVPLSINAANYAYFIALEKALTLKHPDVPKIFAEQMVNLHRGQGLDIYWRCSLKCPSEEEYKDMVIRKTGGLFGMAVNFMQLFSANTTDYKPLLDALGLWFQIRDDFANLVDTSYHEAKDFADDLTEGKFSFPVVHAINSFPDDHQVMAILRQRTSNRAVKEHCIQHLRKLGSLAHTARTLIRLELECRRIVEELGGNPHVMLFFEEYSKASEGSDSEKAEKRRFELHYDSLNDSGEKSNVPTGLQMFSAYRQGILNPDIVSTQAAASKMGEGEKGNEPTTSGAVRVPPTWLKSRSVLGRLASGHVPTIPGVPSSSSASATSITATQKIPYEPQSTLTKAGVPVDCKNLLVSQRQRGNPLLELIRHVPWEYAAIEPDYVFGPSQCAFFLSLRYHNLNPEYIFERLQKLKSTFQLIVLIVLVDVDDAHHPLKELNKFGLTQNVTVLLAWSFLEAARYVECFKVSVNKPPEELQSEAAVSTAQKDQLTLATDFFTSLRIVSRSDAAALLSRFRGVFSTFAPS
ncbi:Geranylgeranyl pyrophosphate synthase [Echinococcus granulosus]|uniref:Geranylgeranyl pyrophosphate synthase n=1 Tax=Echinococcus granulosus TaxID=6210 RepID=W6UJU1_ECHGR|nr:Geranylgeranyl pyrophosphate synthase [Echinococcus granulosus]EUB61810.1 Geranylgeranyl pyrophosphate synthase [Echinococcus granulosus]